MPRQSRKKYFRMYIQQYTPLLCFQDFRFLKKNIKEGGSGKDKWMDNRQAKNQIPIPNLLLQVWEIQILSTKMGKGGPALHCVNAKHDQDLCV